MLRAFQEQTIQHLNCESFCPFHIKLNQFVPKSLSSIIFSKLMKRRNNNKANGNYLFVRIHTWPSPVTPVVCCLLYVGCLLSTPFNASTFNNTVHDFFQFINNTIFNNLTSWVFWRFCLWCTIIH